MPVWHPLNTPLFSNLSVNQVMQKYLQQTDNVNTGVENCQPKSNDSISCHSPVVITVRLSHITYLQLSQCSTQALSQHSAADLPGQSVIVYKAIYLLFAQFHIINATVHIISFLVNREHNKQC